MVSDRLLSDGPVPGRAFPPRGVQGASPTQPPRLAPTRAERRPAILLAALLLAVLLHALIFGLLRHGPTLPPPAPPTTPVVFERPPAPALRRFAAPAPLPAPAEAMDPPSPMTTENDLPTIVPLDHLAVRPRQPRAGQPRTAHTGPTHQNGAAATAREAAVTAGAPAPDSGAATSAIAPSCGIQTPPFPPAARLLHQAGSAIVSLRVAPGGTVTGVALSHSSGSDALDDAALAAAHDARCVNEGHEAVTMHLPVRFHLY